MDLAAIAAEWWIKWAFGIIGGAIIAGYNHLRKKQKEQEVKQAAQQAELEKRQRAIENGMQAILRDRILTSYYHYHARGNITLHGLENVEKMFESYSALHGNGTVPHLVEAMREMEVVDDKFPASSREL